MGNNRRFNRFASPHGSALTVYGHMQPESGDSLAAADQEIFGTTTTRQTVIPDNALVEQANGSWVYRGFVLTATGMAIPDGTTEPDWQDVGRVLRGMVTAVSWWVGDWAAYANQEWNATAKAIAAIFEYEPSTIESYLSVAKAVPGMIRNHTVSFSHHRLVMGLPEDQQRYWIERAAQAGWTLTEMRKIMNQRPALSRWISDDTHKEWGFLRSLEGRKRTPDERNQVQIKIDRVRAALDEVERKLWEE